LVGATFGELYEGSQARLFYDPENPGDHVLECSTIYEVAEDVAPIVEFNKMRTLEA